ncbi:MAG: DNA gyrase inhibitor YacG [Betaproteobacteria bacterium]|nr:DNA gyrase inhibitor YacG [Betaproteobacteria bacterium]
MFAVISSPCPHCNRETPRRTENPWRPFCSERCKLIDLGNWAGERYRLPEENSAEAISETSGELI